MRPVITRLRTRAYQFSLRTGKAPEEVLGDFAQRRGHTLLELAFSWLLAQSPVASVIAGATRPEQLEQNVKAGGWKLSPEELAEIDRITAG